METFSLLRSIFNRSFNMIDTNPKTERISTLLGVVNGKITKRVIPQEISMEIADCGYRADEHLPGEDRNWRPFEGVWAGEAPDSHYWFHFFVEVPQEAGNYRLNFETSDNQWKWDDCNNPQMLVYMDGEPIQAFDWNHRYLTMECGKHEIYIYAHSGCWVNEIWADESRSFLLKATLTEVDLAVESLYYDLKVPFEAALCMEEGDYNRERILNLLNEALTLIDVREGSPDFAASVEEARRFMAEKFYGEFCQKTDVKAHFTGHAHIDVAWLWPARQSREKAERTFTSMLHLMETYPDLHFFASTPLLYKWLKEERPSLYKKIKEQVAGGRWGVDCATFVEPDMNMPSGESLVRQFLYGKTFLQKEFGRDSEILWVPDCFGFAGTLPQIMKGFGVKQLVTTKLGWNDTNQMPHDSFIWRGVDGSEVYAYFMTAQDVPLHDGKGNRKSFTTYSSVATPSQTMGAWEGFREKEILSDVHLAFGYGDGGGGPSADQIEYVERMRHGIPGVPTATFSSVEDFISIVQKKMEANRQICPRWDGELYFELHRGVYTTVARNKRFNRKTEFALHNAEWLAEAGVIWNQTEYPKAVFDTCWEKTLEYQFHDIIPGSSIGAVYEETDLGYAEIARDLAKVEEAQKEGILARLPVGGTLIWNHTPFTQTAPILTETGCQIAKDIPAYGYKVIEEFTRNEPLHVCKDGMENDFIRVAFDEKFRIISLYDKEADRELIEEGKVANRLVVYDDIPTYFEAWEIRKQYRLKSYEVEDVTAFELIEEGSRVGVKVERHYLDSVICQTMWLYAHSKMVEFETDIDWHCQRALLKAEFPLDINTTQAICDAPYGSVERSITQNTTWEQAKFEVCAHKYADLSEGNYGVALLNDCKYGYSFQPHLMELTLLRTAKHPYPEADLCRHVMRYAIYPHANHFYNSDVVKEAYVFNNPLQVQQVVAGDGTLPRTHSLVSSSVENVIVDTVKQSEDGATMILRLYEASNTRTKGSLSFGFPVQKVMTCDMMEREEENLTMADGRLEILMKPFEIKTLKVWIDR